MIFIKLREGKEVVRCSDEHDKDEEVTTKASQSMAFNWFDMEYRSPHSQYELHLSDRKSVKNDIKQKEKSIQQNEKKQVITRKRIHTHKGINGSKFKEEGIITNLSSRKLTQPEVAVLSKGFSFIPTRGKIDMAKIHSDLAEWERHMRLREYFFDREGDEEIENKEEKWKKKESFFTPEPGRDKFLDSYIDAVKDDIVMGKRSKVDANLSREEQRALTTLLKDTNIVIRPADKDSGVVVIDSKAYIQKLKEEVTGNKTYEETDGQGLARAEKMVKTMTRKMLKEGLISKDMKEYLVPKHPGSGKLRGNPKLHKQGNPYRTIVNGIGTVTERMAEISERELNDYVESTPSYIRDTTDFLNRLTEIPSPLPESVILFCFDVVKLYPSIPRTEGIAACKEALDARCNPDIPTKAVTNMIETVDNNVFQFNNKEYLQKEGVAIGSKLGRNFACTYMRKWDEELMRSDKKPLFYKRFIDDGFGLWEHGMEELVRFKEHVNRIHPNIQTSK